MVVPTVFREALVPFLVRIGSNPAQYLRSDESQREVAERFSELLGQWKLSGFCRELQTLLETAISEFKSTDDILAR